MNDSKRPFVSNLESAKAWIHQAEQSFGQDADIRGELNLLLAQAELQRVREANRARQWRWKYPLLRHSLALVLALIAVIGGFYLWDSRTTIQLQPVTINKEAVVPVAQQLQPTQAPLPAAYPQPSAAEQQPPATIVNTAVTTNTVNSPPPVQPSQRENVPANRDHEIQLSQDEMQKLIRAAGKSLRGQ